MLYVYIVNEKLIDNLDVAFVPPKQINLIGVDAHGVEDEGDYHFDHLEYLDGAVFGIELQVQHLIRNLLVVAKPPRKI